MIMPNEPNQSDLTLTRAEAKALFDIIDNLTGGSPENLFDWEEGDNPADPDTSALLKLFTFCGQDVPEYLKSKP
jgi:hypothetical protein